MNIVVPWNASWTSEEKYEIRPCRWAGGKLAMWSPHSPTIGKPVFAKPHMVRQRQSIAAMVCTVCGKITQPNDRYWFKLGSIQEGWFMTTEAPVHKACGEFSLGVCPHLRGRHQDFQKMPGGYSVLSAIIGGPATDKDFGVVIGSRKVIGHLKLAWPSGAAK